MSDTKGTTYRFNWLAEHLGRPEEIRLFAEDVCMLAVTGEIIRAMEAKGIDRSTLADRIGKSKSFVSQALTGSRNMTLRTAADLLWACGLEVTGLKVTPLGEMTVPMEDLDAWLDGESCSTEFQKDEVVISADKQLSVPLIHNAAEVGVVA